MAAHFLNPAARGRVGRARWTPAGRLAGRATPRHLLAALLAAAGAWALLADQDRGGGAEVLVAAREVPAGRVLAAEDLARGQLPPHLVPGGALTDAAQAIGRVIPSGARKGEVLTDVRLLAARPSEHLAGVPDARTVPVRLADPDLAALLRPGDLVDVVAAGPGGEEDGGAAEGSAPGGAQVLARAAPVVALPDLGATAGQGLGGGAAGKGRIVLLALPSAQAAQVAAAALDRLLTVTLH